MDARKLTAEQSSEIRQKVVTLHQAGMAIKDIMLETGLCRQAVDRTIKRHQAGETQTPQARGKKQGSGQLLSEECQSSICDQVFSRRPWQLGMDVGGYLWTRESLQALILKQYGIEVSERVMRIYLQRWGIKQNTHKSRIERCTPTIRTWLMTHYPVVEAIAQSEGAKILWLCRHITIPHPFGANQQKRKKHTLMSVVDHRDSLRDVAVFKVPFPVRW